MNRALYITVTTVRVLLVLASMASGLAAATFGGIAFQEWRRLPLGHPTARGHMLVASGDPTPFVLIAIGCFVAMVALWGLQWWLGSLKRDS